LKLTFKTKLIVNNSYHKFCLAWVNSGKVGCQMSEVCTLYVSRV